MSQDRRHRITVYAQTDVGMVRAGNEDTFLVLNLETSDTWTPVTVGDDPPEQIAAFDQGDAGAILAVSDGMGGALAGEVASRMAVEGVRTHMLYFQTNESYSSFPFHERLRLAVEQANAQINNESMGNADYAGMGATFTAAGVHEGVLTLAQIGDSRCYLIRNDRIALVTHDQSLVWQLVEAGHITEEEAETHQYKNVILQALGAQPRVNVVVDRIPLNQGDVVILCSDGLSGRVRADEMLSIVTKAESLREACEGLIDLANERGGEDNITVIVARFEGDALPPPGELTSERVERDPNLPYDIEEDVFADAETTLSPEEKEADEARDASGEAKPEAGAEVTAHRSGQAATRKTEPETAYLDPAKLPPATDGDAAPAEMTSDAAAQIARLNDPSKAPIPTMVGMPALTVDEITADARLHEVAKAQEDREKAPDAPDPVAAAHSGRKFTGALAALVVVIALAAVAWYVYQQQTTASAERAQSRSLAATLDRRARDARNRLGTLSPTIDGMQPGPHHSEAIQLNAAILGNLDRVTPLVQRSQGKPETLTEAQQLVDAIDGDINRLETLVATAPRPEPASAPGAVPEQN